MDSRERVRAWLDILFERYREQANKLSLTEREAIPRYIGDLMPPCQVTVIWAQNPEFQILIFSHLAHKDDRLVNIVGPIENQRLIEVIEKEILTDPSLKGVEKEAESYLVSALQQVQGAYNPLGEPLRSQIASKSGIRYRDTYGWVVYGNVTNMDVETVVGEEIRTIKSLATSAVATQPQPEDKIVLEGWGTYIYPPVWIGNLPQPTFREKVIESRLWPYSSERIINTTYKGYPLIITRDGYVAIGTEEKSKALEALNGILACTLIYGITVCAIREVELGKATFKERSFNLGSPAFGVRRELFHTGFVARYEEIMRKRHVIDPSSITNPIKLAELLTSDERLRTHLLLFLEAHTHMLNSEYKQALLMGWIIIESDLEKLWSDRIKSTEDRGRIGKLEHWHVDEKLEAMNIAHIINPELYTAIMEIKKERNDVVHKGKEPSKSILEKCLDLSSTIISSYVGKLMPAA